MESGPRRVGEWVREMAGGRNGCVYVCVVREGAGVGGRWVGLMDE